MPADPLVYIIILSWNGKADTVECLRSLELLEYPNHKLLVVDNASSDGTAEAVRKEFPGVELIVNERNLRFAGGNNVGIRWALRHGADYVLIINNDTEVTAEMVSELVRVAESGRSLDGCATASALGSSTKSKPYPGSATKFYA